MEKIFVFYGGQSRLSGTVTISGAKKCCTSYSFLLQFWQLSRLN